MAVRLTGAMYTYQTHVLYVGPLAASAPHKHHAGQVMWAPGGLVVTDEHGDEHRVTAYVVPPETLHSHGEAAFAAVLWTDRDDAQWRSSTATDEGGVFPPSIRAEAGEPLAPHHARGVAQALLHAIAVDHDWDAQAPRHPAVTRLCALLESTASEQEIRMTQLAKQAGLSMRQLRHRFTEEIGINPRGYRRWRRLRHAITAIEHGATLTQAAVTAGFADGAHFSRVFQSQFGMTPSRALSMVQFAGSLDQ